MDKGQPFGFDRVVPDELLATLRRGGFASSLIARRNSRPELFDVQLRKQPKGAVAWASLYVGLTTILDLDLRGGHYRVRAHPTHRRAGSFDTKWNQWMTPEAMVQVWPAVEQYVDRVTPLVSKHLTEREGAVHAALCSGRARRYSVVNREATPWFVDQVTKNAIVASMVDPLVTALNAASEGLAWWPGVRRPVRPFGTSLDILAVDDEARVLAIEAKPSNALAGITLGPAQVLLYAELFARWMAADTRAAQTLTAMHQQRVDLGLSRATARTVAADVPIVPVLAIGAGPRSPAVVDRLRSVAKALEPLKWSRRVQPLEVWELDEHGDIASELAL